MEDILVSINSEMDLTTMVYVGVELCNANTFKSLCFRCSDSLEKENYLISLTDNSSYFSDILFSRTSCTHFFLQ